MMFIFIHLQAVAQPSCWPYTQHAIDRLSWEKYSGEPRETSDRDCAE
jgi:hypothetical protein